MTKIIRRLKDLERFALDMSGFALSDDAHEAMKALAKHPDTKGHNIYETLLAHVYRCNNRQYFVKPDYSWKQEDGISKRIVTFDKIEI